MNNEHQMIIVFCFPNFVLIWQILGVSWGYDQNKHIYIKKLPR
jgi:hypothetical protein